MGLPLQGAVIGIDVGCSPSRRSSAVCRLDWTADELKWSIVRFRATDTERHEAISKIADRPIIAAALDGPLKGGLQLIGHYRLAEQILTIGLGRLIGKPGQSSTPVGKLLNEHTNACAIELLKSQKVQPSVHLEAIDRAAIVEAFPSAFLGMILDDPKAIVARRGDRSDTYYVHLSNCGELSRLVARLLPGRVTPDFSHVTNHDDRAALICALTALGVAADDYVAVGDEDGWIVLPPLASIRPWALEHLRSNAIRRGGLHEH